MSGFRVNMALCRSLNMAFSAAWRLRSDGVSTVSEIRGGSPTHEHRKSMRFSTFDNLYHLKGFLLDER